MGHKKNLQDAENVQGLETCFGVSIIFKNPAGSTFKAGAHHLLSSMDIQFHPKLKKKITFYEPP